MSRVNERELYTDIYNEEDKTMQRRWEIERQHTHTGWIRIYGLNSTTAMGLLSAVYTGTGCGCSDRCLAIIIQ